MIAAALSTDEVQSNAPLAALLGSRPVWGPHFHRWGNAFPAGEPLGAEAAVVPEAQVLFVGDYVGSSTGGEGGSGDVQGGAGDAGGGGFGSVEAALVSGLSAAESLAAHAKL